ncbi:MAG: Ig-like domain-containing protein [Pirellulales bacterium]
MGRHRSRAWGKYETNGKSLGRSVRALPTRPLRMEALERRLLLTASPAIPDLLAVSDAGVYSTDNLTNLDNSRPEKSLQFAVGNTIAGATVTLYADGVVIGSAVANGATTTLTSNGSLDLIDGMHAITARQTLPGESESPNSAVLMVTVDTIGPLLNPLRLGGYDTSGIAFGIAVEGSLAYVADHSAGLVILDVSDAEAPVLVGALDTSGYAYDVAVSGTRAYVADGTAGLVILDVSNSAAPVRLGGFDTSGDARDVTVRGALAYVADGSAGLVIIDVSDPGAPVRLGKLDTAGSAYGVDVQGTRAYVADYTAGLAIIDVTNPAAPVLLGTLDTNGTARGVAIVGTLAYVADDSAGLAIIDATNPVSPALLGRYDTSGYAYGVAISGTLAYVADHTAGLQIIDVASPAAPLQLGRFDTSGLAYGVAVVGTVAYVADGTAGLAILDLGSPAAPAALDLKPTSDTGFSNADNITAHNTPTFGLTVPLGFYFRVYRDGVLISGGYETGASYTAMYQPDGSYNYTLAVVDGAGNLSAPSAPLTVRIDISIPSAPELSADCDTGISNTDRLTNLDNSRPEKALWFTVGNTIVGATVTICADGTAIGSAVALSGTTTVTTNGSWDLAEGPHVITARQTRPGQPESPESAALSVTVDTVAPDLGPALLGAYDTLGTAYGVAISGTLACVADYSTGLQVLDIGNPLSPVRLGWHNTTGLAVDVAISGSLAYLVNKRGGLETFDIDDPRAPRLLGSCSTGWAQSVTISGTLAYVAEDRVLRILDVADPATPRAASTFLIGADTWAVAVAGTVAYVAADRGLTILDVSNPAAPLRLGGFETGGSAKDVVVRNGLAYVADSVAGLVILDVSDPTAPARLGGYVPTGGQAYGVAVWETAVYLAVSGSGVQILDVTNPAAPVRVSSCSLAVVPRGVVSFGSLACIALGNGGIQIVDASRAPSLQPASRWGFNTMGAITADTTPTFDIFVPPAPYYRVYRDGVQVSGDWRTASYYTAIIEADGTYRYSIAAVDEAGNISTMSPAFTLTLDTSIPSAPDLVAASDTGISSSDNLTNLDNGRPEKSLQFTVHNTIAGATVSVYADGALIGSAVAESTTTTVTTNGSLALAEGTRAITARQTLPGRPESIDSAALAVMIDTVAPGAAPVRLGDFDTAGLARGVAVSGSLAYVADDSAGLMIFDISDPAALVRLGRYATSGVACDVVVSGTLAYMADGSAGLEIIDVANPAAPVRLGGYGTSASAVCLSGSLAYVAGNGLEIIDVTNPAAPVRLGGCDTGGAQAVAVSGTVAYLARYSEGLVMIDVSNPSAPVRLGGCDTSGYACGVAVSGTVAYVADDWAHLQVIDVTNPAAPVWLDNYDTSRSAYGVTLSGRLAYVAAEEEGLLILDVSKPASPVWLGTCDTSGSAQAVAVSGTRAYVADDDMGLVVVDVSLPPSAPDLQTASDTGSSNSDNITARTRPTFELSVSAGSYFRFYRDGMQISGDYETGTSYTTPVQPDGTYGYAVAAVDAAGNLSSQSPPRAVTIDTRPPVVQNILVGGTQWTGGFLEDLNTANAANVGGFSIPVGSGRQLAPLPWANIDQIKVVFSENVSMDKADLALSGVNQAQYDIAGATFSYDPGTFTATWTLAGAIAADKLEIRLNADSAGPIQDPIGKPLDGEWTNPATSADTSTDTYPSGNGTAGGDFVFRFRTLPCDANQDGAVDIFDVAKLQVNYGQDQGMMPADGDFDGNGTVDIFDVALLQVQYGRTLDPPAPAPAAAPTAEAVDRTLRQPLAATVPSAADDLAEAIALARGAKPTTGIVSSTRAAAAGGTSALSAGVDRRPIQRHGAHAGNATPTRPLAVHHAVENAAWVSVVDRLLEAEMFELAR